MRTIRRTSAALAVAGALVLATTACNSAAPAPAGDGNGTASDAPITIRYSAPVPGALPFLPIDIAIEKGYFAEEGVTVELLQTSAQALPAALSSGQLDMTADVVFNVGRYLENGVDVQFVSGLNNNVDFTLVSAKNFDVPAPDGADGWRGSFAALRGQSIGVAAKAGPVGLTVTQLMTEAGVAPGEYTLIDTPGPAAGNALAAGQVAAVVSGGGFDLPLVENDLGDFVLRLNPDVDEYFGDMSNSALSMTARAIEANPDAPERVQRAIAKAVAFIQDPANAEEVTAIATAAGTPPSEGLSDRLAEYDYDATLSLTGLQAGFEWAKLSGITSDVVDPATVIADGIEAE